MAGVIGNLGGRPRKSTAEKMQLGTYRRDKEKVSEVVSLVPKKGAPKHLSGAAKSVWRQKFPQLVAMGLMADSDRECLERYCVLMALFRRLQRQVDQAEGGDEDAMDQMKVLSNLNVQIRSCEDRLGFNPMARSRMRPAVQRQEEKPKSKLLRFIGGQAS